MNRALQYFNAFGVAALAVVCVLQWRINRELNLKTIQLEKEVARQRVRIEEQDKHAQGQAADLDNFREHVRRATAELKVAESNLLTSRHEALQLTGERDQLKESIASWSKAVEERDEQLKRASAQIQELGNERAATVTRFNELAQKYNQVVEDLNARTREFNAVVERYNSLVRAASSSK